MINLVFYRKKCNLTQAQLAELVGVSQNTISSLEVGQFSPRLSTAIKIVRVIQEHYPSYINDLCIYNMFEEIKKEV